MATNNPTPIGGNDPSVFRQIQAQNAALQQRPSVASAPVLSSSGVSLTPIVSGNETLFPQSTTATSGDAVTITSSVNNDSGDVTTVYTTGGAITVNPVNQTINYYTATDSGVSQIVAGSGVTITATGANGTGAVTINATGGGSNYTLPIASGGTLGGIRVGSGLSIDGSGILSTTAGNIAILNLSGSNSNVLYGNGVFAPVTGGANIGNLEVTGTTIGIANGASETAIVIGANNSSLTLDTDSGVPVVNLQVQSTDSQYYQEISDYTSGTWVVNGLEGTLTITGYSLGFETFLNNLGQYQSYTITVNGSETTATNGYSYGGGTATFYTLLPPGVDPTTVNNIQFNLVFSNQLLMDPDEGDMLFRIGDFNLNITSQRDVNITVADDLRLRGNDFVGLMGNNAVTIEADSSNTGITWTFNPDGNLALASGNSIIKSVPNNAGDLSGLSTLNLYPDSATLDDRYLIVDPTGPNHLHIRAGGAIDGSNTLLFLGGEQAFVQIDDTVHEVQISSYDSANTTNYYWRFNSSGQLVLPGTQGLVYSPNGNDLRILNNQSAGFTQLGWQDGAVLTPGANLASNVTLNSSGFVVSTTNDSFTTTNDWVFGTDGNLTLPGNTVAINFANNTPAFGNVSGINLDGNVSNVLRGDGTWAPDAAGTYGDSNVTSLLGAFGSNTIVTTGIITADGANLSNVPYANLTGAPTLGNISSINLDGNSQTWLAGNGVFANISIPSVGNIATLNLDGNASNVLLGNGAFAQLAAANVSGLGNIATINLDSNASNVLLGNGVFSGVPLYPNAVVWTTAPGSNTATGTAGEAAYDSGGNLYVCVSTNTWAKFSGTTSW